MWLTAMVAGGVMTMIMLAGPAVRADDTPRPSSAPEQEGAKAEQQARHAEVQGSADESRRAWRPIRGEVERIKRVALRGEREGDHLVALVTDRMGHRMIVDLGQAGQYRSLPITTGDEILVRGPIAWIGERKVLLAQRAFIGGEKIKIKRDRMVDAGRLSRSTVQGKETSVTGEIERAKELRLRGVDRQHMVVRLKTQDGRTMLADLGSPQDLSRVALDQGRSISVEGPIIQVSGKPMILAKHVTADGKSVEIDRDLRSVMPAMHRGQPGAERDQQASAETPKQAVSGQIVVKGEILKVDRDGVYVVRDESGNDTMLVTPDVEGKGLHIGDRVTAQVKPDGTVLSLDKQQ